MTRNNSHNIPSDTDVHGFTAFIGLVKDWAKSGDKDMRANWAMDGLMTLICICICIFIFSFIGLPFLGRLPEGGPYLVLLLVCWLVYQLPYKAVKECYKLLKLKLKDKGYEIE